MQNHFWKVFIYSEHTEDWVTPLGVRFQLTSQSRPRLGSQSLTDTLGSLHRSVIPLGEQAPPRAPGQIRLLPLGWPSIGSSPTFLNSQCSWVGFRASGLRLTSRLHLLCCLSAGLVKSSVGKVWELLTEARYYILFADTNYPCSICLGSP